MSTKQSLSVVVAVVLLSIGFASGAIASVQLQGCGDFGGDHAIAWLVCSWRDTNQRVDALEARLAQLEGRTLTPTQVQGLAWDKAQDRVSLLQQQSTAYTDKWFYDELYKRFKIHVCRSGVPHNATFAC